MVLGFLRRRARRAGIADGRSGAVAIVQRFGGALNLNVHLHALVLDGVSTKDGNVMRFHPGPRLTRDDVAQVVTLIARLLERRGVAGSLAGGEAPDLWSEEAPVLAVVAAASVEGRVALGLGRGRAYAGAATHRRRSRQRRWGPVTPTRAGSTCTRDS